MALGHVNNVKCSVWYVKYVKCFIQSLKNTLHRGKGVKTKLMLLVYECSQRAKEKKVVHLETSAGLSQA